MGTNLPDVPVPNRDLTIVPLTVEELQFICARCGPPVRVYQITQDVNEEFQFALMPAAGLDVSMQDDEIQIFHEPVEIDEEVVHVVLDFDAQTGCGHFSRLWSAESWTKAQEDGQPLSQSSNTSCSDSESELSSCSTTDDLKKQGTNQDSCGAASGSSCGASHSQTAKPKDDESHQHDVCDSDLDSLSEASETVDANSVEVDPIMAGTTREDQEIARRDVLKNKLRAHPLMPCDPQDPSQPFLDMDSGMRLPLVH